MLRRLTRCATLVPLLLACSSEDATSTASEPNTDDPPATAGGPDDPTASDDEWTTLLTGDWSMPPTEEGYVCARKTIDEEIIIKEFEAINPVGTHHTLLTMGDPDEPDGMTDCTAADNHSRSLFGSGLGTDPFAFPEGVGLRVPAGSQLLLNLHIFNTSSEELTGTSGTRAKLLPAAELEHEAEGLLAGTVAIDIPPGATTEHVGYCTMSSDVTIFAVAPHMHQLGTYERVVAESASLGEVVLYDAPYSFEEQSYLDIDPIELLEGERMRVECTHENTTESAVGFGDSSLEEMCFAGFYRYPADFSPLICVDGVSFGSRPTLDGPPCAESGAPGNTEGIGKHCTTDGGECGEGAFCLADFTQGSWGNFCTTTCSADDECGEGAVCSPPRQGSSIRTCVPEACVDTATISE